MFGLRQKLLLASIAIFVVMLVLGLQSIREIGRLGGAIDVILRENYRSVVACQNMKESLERVDSGLLFLLIDNRTEGLELAKSNIDLFQSSLDIQKNNITLPGEREKTDLLVSLFENYRRGVEEVLQAPERLDQETYHGTLYPLFKEIKATAQEILDMNQENMNTANGAASQRAVDARRRMMIYLFIGVAIALVSYAMAGRWILRPIQALKNSAMEVERGVLDLVVPVHSADEIGRLSESFNAMVASLRNFRRSDEARLTRVQRATQAAFEHLPDAVAVVSPDGIVEVATEIARSAFGLRPAAFLNSLGHPWMMSLFNEVMRTGTTALRTETPHLVQHFVHGEEHYFRPKAVPIVNDEAEVTGVILVMENVTHSRENEEIKQGLVATVSHQLRTPLTSLRMSIHLLLDERVGWLTGKQSELLIGARDDCERLQGIVDDLLDIGNLQGGKYALDRMPAPPDRLAATAIDEHRTAAQTHGIALSSTVPTGMPDVWVDEPRLQHVFANLMTNALAHTSPGGTVTVSATAEDREVRFQVKDTGSGIPNDHIERIFEPFYRVPGQDDRTGVGLGLAIAKEIVEAHGGSIAVESKEGVGTTFAFSVPRADRVNAKELKGTING